MMLLGNTHNGILLATKMGCDVIIPQRRMRMVNGSLRFHILDVALSANKIWKRLLSTRMDAKTAS